MGRRRNRKLERRKHQSAGDWANHEIRPIDPEIVAFGRPREYDYGDVFGLSDHSLRAVVTQKTCGGCREFVEDSEGGRGNCLHPGSGIVSPWTDTKACDFYAARRR
ncbi:MAG: hypothetical protein ACKVT1_01905 [Dehalococcoidia bacterium]